MALSSVYIAIKLFGFITLLNGNTPEW